MYQFLWPDYEGSVLSVGGAAGEVCGTTMVEHWSRGNTVN